MTDPTDASTNTSNVDVVVVGAGISGLVTATRLVAAGLTCVVLESSARVGGRLLTHHHPSGPLDLGATWFWPGEQRVAALIAELNIPTHAQHIDGDAVYHAPGGVQRLDGNPIDVVAGRFSSGAASITDTLAERLGERVWLTAPVHRIDNAGDRMVVHHQRGSHVACHVVLALPPSLAVHHIEFQPALDDHIHDLAAATPIWMGNIAKAVIVYPDAFWRGQGLAGAAISHIGPLREVHDMSGPDAAPAALFGFAPLAPGVPTPSQHDIVAQLVDLFGPAAATPLDVIVTDWRPDARPDTHTDARPDRDNRATGTPTGTYGHRLYQHSQGGGRLHWASTETAPTMPGHIEGALGGAQRAVDAITTAITTAATTDPLSVGPST